MLRNRAIVAGAAVVVLVGLAVFLGLPSGLMAPGLSAGPTRTGSSGDGGASAAPSQVDGLEVISVQDALARRAAGSTDRLAVFGWVVRFFVPCPQLPNAYQPLESCVYDFTWFMAAPEQLQVVNPDGSRSIRPPAGAGFNTTYDPLDPAVPQAVVLIGRFHDLRSALCPAGSRRDACGRLFVAEGAAWLGPISTGAPAGSLPGSPGGQSPGAS